MTGFYSVANAIASLIVVMMIGYKLITDHSWFRPVGRWGAGITAAGSLLTGAAWAFPDSPFNGWSVVMLRFGVALILIDWFHWWKGQRGN